MGEMVQDEVRPKKHICGRLDSPIFYFNEKCV